MSKLHLFRSATAPFEESDPPLDRIVSGTPRGQAKNVFESEDGRMFSGVWRATVGAWRVAYNETEYCHITKGFARLTQDGGASVDVKAGDAFVIASGFVGVWEVLEDMEKHYLIVLP
jgi:uncharacterized protein